LVERYLNYQYFGIVGIQFVVFGKINGFGSAVKNAKENS
jgi:hypothetical protein